MTKTRLSNAAKNMCFSKQIKWFDIWPDRQTAKRNLLEFGFHSIVFHLAFGFWCLFAASQSLEAWRK